MIKNLVILISERNTRSTHFLVPRSPKDTVGFPIFQRRNLSSMTFVAGVVDPSDPLVLSD